MNEKELREKRDQIVEQMQAITDNATNVEEKNADNRGAAEVCGLKERG